MVVVGIAITLFCWLVTCNKGKVSEGRDGNFLFFISQKNGTLKKLEPYIQMASQVWKIDSDWILFTIEILPSKLFLQKHK